jgi:hypothetical protein
LEKNEKGKWGNWSDLELTKMMVSLDTNKNRIVIYSQIIQLFEIKEYLTTTENETDLVYSFSCKDNDEVACTLSIITRKKQDNEYLKSDSIIQILSRNSVRRALINRVRQVHYIAFTNNFSVNLSSSPANKPSNITQFNQVKKYSSFSNKNLRVTKNNKVYA